MGIVVLAKVKFSCLINLLENKSSFSMESIDQRDLSISSSAQPILQTTKERARSIVLPVVVISMTARIINHNTSFNP